MPYIDRLCFDADAHVMEPKDWLNDYADPAVRPLLKDAFAFDFDLDKAKSVVDKRRHDAERRAKGEEKLLAEAFQSFGAFDGSERLRALDLLGIRAQLIFQTFAFGQFGGIGAEHELLYGGTRAHNRAITEWCSPDPERLLPVCYLPMRVPADDVAVLDEALAMGAKAILLPTAYADLSPTHTDFDPIWARLAEAGIPFVTHIGTGGRLTPKGYRNNGRPIPPDIHGGGENIRSKDFLGVHQWPEYFLSIMALDGVFAKFPNLRGASIEQGAVWVPSLLRNLDMVQDAFKREPDIQSLPMRGSEYVRDRVKFTPFYQEPMDWLTEQLGPEMCLFSTDYPHYEGGRDPLARFEASFGEVSEDVKDRFYARNFLDLMGLGVTASA